MNEAGPSLVDTVVGQFLLTLTIATPLAFLVSMLLLAIYRRAVRRGMMARAPHGTVRRPQETITAAGGPELSPRACPSIELVSLDRLDTSQGRRLRVASALVELVSACAFAAAMMAMFAAAQSLKLDALAASYLVVTYLWPIVATLSVTFALTWRTVLGIAMAYGLALAATIGGNALLSDVPPLQMLEVWATANLPGSLLLLPLLARPARAVGPLVAAFMIAAVAGALAIAIAAGRNQALLEAFAMIGTVLHLGGAGTSALLLLTGAALMGVLGWMLLRGLGRLYRQRKVSDRSLMLDAVWLVFSADYGISLAQQGPVWALAPAVAFGAYKTVSLLLFANLGGGRNEPAAPELLLLRVFALGRKSERLFDALQRAWRHVGSIRMIAGPDLVSATVEPHQFLDFIAGRLPQSFIRGPDDVEKRLKATGPRRDFDTRFRTANFFCHDDSWKMTLQRLSASSDTVLMDLRGFSANNRGCIYEIETLLDEVPLDRVLFIVDETTNAAYLESVLRSGWSRIGPTSPNRHAREAIRICRIGGSAGRAVPGIVALLSATG